MRPSERRRVAEEPLKSPAPPLPVRACSELGRVGKKGCLRRSTGMSMSSGCISSASTMGCIDAQVPVRVTYRNLYKWPESDVEFVKSVTRAGGGAGEQQSRVVDGYSCRQMYLRSYTFTKKEESVPERTKKCLGRVKERVAAAVAANGKRVPGCAVPLWVNGGAGKVDAGMASAGDSGGRKKASRGVRRLRDSSSSEVVLGRDGEKGFGGARGMSSGCISCASTMGCIDAEGPVRVTYRNLYKWPESDAEFVKSVTRGGGGAGEQKPRVVDSYSCRQMYLRSYTFTKKESVPERTKKCLGRVKERVAAAVAANGKKVPGCAVPLWVNGGAGKVDAGMASAGGRGGRKKGSRGVRRLRDASSAAFCSIFHRLLSCTAKVEVVGH